MEVTLDELNINAEEGDVLQVCALVNAVLPMRERDVILEFTLTPYGQFASKTNIIVCSISQNKSSIIIVISVNSGESDTRIINDTTQIVAPMSDMACVFVELIDDEIAESAEIFIFNVTANNILDQVVNGTTTIEVADNDGIIIMLANYKT